MSAGSDRGALIVVAAPSGAGKTTLVHALLERFGDVRFSISHTTRRPRPSERNGIDYHFVTEDEFRRMIEADAFLEHARVFDHWYGTSRNEVEAARSRGLSVLLEIDWQGARQVRNAAPDATTIFIVPPSIEALEQRLRARRTDDEATIARRLRDSVSDLGHFDEFEYVVVNDDLGEAVAALERIVAGRGEAYRCGTPTNRARIESILATPKRLQ